MAKVKTVNFLPNIHRSNANKKFLSTTLDQLIEEPELTKLSGYIGRRVAPTYKVGDNYVTEPTTERKNYQLEPGATISDEFGNVVSHYTYPDLIQAISNLGGVTNNHSRLFSSEYYNYTGCVDIDKVANFHAYWWCPEGLSPVQVSAGDAPLERTFVVTRDVGYASYKFDSNPGDLNPTITLVRGGEYKFSLSQSGNNFWIQTSSTIDGSIPGRYGVDARDVYGVTNNGASSGEILFEVPQETEQDDIIEIPLFQEVDMATTLKFNDIHGRFLSDVVTDFGGIDGIQYGVDSKYIIFLNDSTDPHISFANKRSVWQISTLVSGDELTLSVNHVANIPAGEKVFIKSGATYSNYEYYIKNSTYTRVPSVTAPIDTLYYVDGTTGFYGKINIIGQTDMIVRVDEDIVGQPNYVSPNGVDFTNGLHVSFDSGVLPATYAGKSYYVEGVGTSIRLVDSDSLITPEKFTNLEYQEFDTTLYDEYLFDQTTDTLSEPDYITINRSSIDNNAWSRSNRWFHADVIHKTAEYNGVSVDFTGFTKAKRPIIEFDADMVLYNSGRVGRYDIDILDFTVTDALNQIEGFEVSADSDTYEYSEHLTLVDGKTIVFSNDADVTVAKKVFRIQFELIDSTPSNRTLVHLEEVDAPAVSTYDTVVCTQAPHEGVTFWFNGDEWVESQQKIANNQEPLFDVFDADGVSFGDTTTYQGSTFNTAGGTKVFSYKRGDGTADSVLGFKLSYRTFNNVGDIEFSNSFETDTFSYQDDNEVLTANVNTGLLAKTRSDASLRYVNVWEKCVDNTSQYQILSFTYIGSNNFEIDVIPETSRRTEFLKVFINGKRTMDFVLTAIGSRTVVTVTSELSLKDKVDVFVFSDDVSSSGFFEIPKNLDLNSLNSSFTDITVGQMRDHLSTMVDNCKEVVQSDTTGYSNARDVSLRDIGGSILQHSAPVSLAQVFLQDEDINLISSIDYARKEYVRFKHRFLEGFKDVVRAGITDSRTATDFVLSNMVTAKTSASPFYYSDMVAVGDDYDAFDHTVLSTDVKVYQFSTAYSHDVLSSRSIVVYHNDVVLVYGRDYTFSDIVTGIIIDDSVLLSHGDVISIRDYASTDGCCVPATPSKLGMYPKYIPVKFLDDTYATPVEVIRGHDGSITVAFGDMRDDMLLDLETRIYNNIKVAYDVRNFDLNDIVPGKFRNTEYSRDEFNQVVSKSFLSWIGDNRIDYVTNEWFDGNNGWTWNYRKFVDKVDGGALPGYWRGVYKFFFDTDAPHLRPWEMLGFADEPAWWVDEYGDAPYTGGNDVLWSDLENGVIRQGERAGIDQTYARAGLSAIIPVDDSGELLSPEKFIVQYYNSIDANLPFVVGDDGPAESAWKRSSDYPFAIQRALALLKPAMFFSIMAETDVYKKNQTTGQFMTDTFERIKISTIKINGETVKSAGYVNWVVDYLTFIGKNAEVLISNTQQFFDVRLAHRVAGFTDKKLVRITAEQNSPSSSNDSVVIPTENYHITLHKSSPVSRLVYSGVIVEKVDGGYAVTGYDVSNPYFTIIPSDPNSNQTKITAGDVSAVVFNDYKKMKTLVPYGFVFSQRQQVVDFLISYGRYLQSAGFVFEDYDQYLFHQRDWVLSAKEFLTWSQQGWQNGSIIALSPVIDTLTVVSETSTVDAITNSSFGSKMVDIGFKTIKIENFDVLRDGDVFSINTNGNSIGLAILNLVQYEHVIVFDNTTVFDDVIYLPEYGNRQYRLKISGNKTSSWDGRLNPPGFVYSDPIIDEWEIGKDYKKGDLVSFKDKYYTAADKVPATDAFDYRQWILVETDSIKVGLLPNFAFDAKKIELAYDIDNQVVDQEYANGLIGFRNRSFLEDMGATPTTQAKFYQGYIRSKGTKEAITALANAKFSNIDGTVDLFEEWALRVGEYGSVENDAFIEVQLTETKFFGDPIAIQLTNSMSDTPAKGFVSVAADELYKKTLSYTKDIIKNRDESSNVENDVLTAGYVNIDDVDFTLFDINDVSTLSSSLDGVKVGSTIWVAKDTANTWGVYRVTESDVRVTSMMYVLDNQCQVTFDKNHGLLVGDHFIVYGFDDGLNGFYTVKQVDDMKNVTVVVSDSAVLLLGDEPIEGAGILLKMISAVVDHLSDVNSIEPPYGWMNGDKLWVNKDNSNEEWAVYTKTTPWDYSHALDVLEYNANNGSGFASAMNIRADGNVCIIGSPDDGSGVVNVVEKSVGKFVFKRQTIHSPNAGTNFFGSSVATAGAFLAIGAYGEDDTRGAVHIYGEHAEVYEYIKTLTLPTRFVGDMFGYSVEFSADNKKLFIGIPGQNWVNVYEWNNVSVDSDGTTAAERWSGVDFVNTMTISDVTYEGDNFGSTIKTNSDGTTLVVGIKGSDTDGKTDSGSAKVYHVDNGFTFIQTLSAPSDVDYAAFATSIAMSGNGRELFIGAPLYQTPFYKNGAVYRYVDEQTTFRRSVGHVTNPVLAAGGKMSINGVEVTLSGTTVEDLVSDITALSIPGITASVTSGKILIEYASESTDTTLVILPVQPSSLFVDLGLEIFAYAEMITHPDHESNEQFGVGLAYDDVTGALVVASALAPSIEYDEFDNGATIFDSGSTVMSSIIKETGAVYIYEEMTYAYESEDTPSTFAFVQRVDFDTIEKDDEFGKSVAIQNGVLLVSVRGEDETFDDIPARVVQYTNAELTKGWEKTRQQSEKVDLDHIIKMYVYDVTTQKINSFLDYVDPVKGKVLGIAEQEITYKTSFDPADYNNGTLVSSLTGGFSAWGRKEVGQVWWDMSTVKFMDYEQSDITYRKNNWGRIFPGSSIDVYEWVESSVPPSQYTGEGTPKSTDDSTYSTENYVDSATGEIYLKYYFWVSGKANVDATLQNRSIGVAKVAEIIANPDSANVPYAQVVRSDAIVLVNCYKYVSADNAVFHIDYAQQKNSNIIHNEWELISEGNNAVPSRILDKLVDSLVGFDSGNRVVPDISLPVGERYGISIRPRQTMVVDRIEAIKNFFGYVNTVLSTTLVHGRYDISSLNYDEALPTDVTETVETFEELSYLELAGYNDGDTFLVLTDANYDDRWVVYELSSGSFVLSRIQSFRTSDYWAYADWYDTSYNRLYKPTYTVATELARRQMTFSVGDTVKVTASYDGRWVIYAIQDSGIAKLVAMENGTIQFNGGLYASEDSDVGFDNAKFENVGFDLNPTVELRTIMNFIRNSLFIDELKSEMNNLFFVMMNYIFTEQQKLDWAFKTSFINVLHKLRKLDQYPNYTRDNQSFYEDYINEVKPFRTKIREYLIDYTGLDTGDIAVSDFDLPAYYDSTTGLWRSPSGEDSGDVSLWQTDPRYIDWYNNHTYSVGEVFIADVGYGFETAPTVVITGGNGTGAKAHAIIDQFTGALVEIVVDDGGYGYTTTPTVTIYGNNSGAKAYARLKNDKVRRISTTISFDRVSYESTGIQTWQPNTEYSANDVVVYGGKTYYAIDAIGADQTVFDPTLFTKMADDEMPDGASKDAAQRIAAFYGGDIDDIYSRMQGVTYPGVIVKSPRFVNEGFGGLFDSIPFDTFDSVDIDSQVEGVINPYSADTIIYSYFTDAALGDRASDIIVDGGEFIDSYSSHGPEELVTGLVRDNLGVQVFTVDPNGSGVNPLGYRIEHDMAGNVEYTRISSDRMATLVAPLAYNDDEIFVDDVSKLATPDPTSKIPGVIFINGEKIHYYGKTTVNGDRVFKLQRGVDGTGTPVVHTAGSRLVDASDRQVVPNTDTNKIWMNLGDPITPTTGIGLWASTTEQANFLRAYPTFLPS